MAVQVGEPADEPSTDMGSAFEAMASEPSTFRVDIRRTGSELSVEIDGELDIATGPLLVEPVERELAAEPPERLVLSCRNLGFVDSSGLNALLSLRAACAGTETEISIIDPPAQLQRLLEMTGLRELFRC